MKAERSLELLIVTALMFSFTSASASSNGFGDRFFPYGTNYALPQFTNGDDRAFEVQYSFKYILFDCEKSQLIPPIKCSTDDGKGLNVYFSFTGEFDFYLGSRESGPVVNRTSNPVFHMRWDILEKKSSDYIEWYDIGFEHRSDGQVVSADLQDSNPASPTFGQYLTEIELQNGNHEYFDTLSRGAW